MNRIIFESRGERLLENLGISKAEFARAMGVKRQNVRSLFKTKNIETIQKAAEIMELNWEFLVSYAEEQDLDSLPMPEISESEQLCPENIPTGDSIEDRKARRDLIRRFYSDWMANNPEGCVYNKSLKDYIYVKYISANETAAHASLRYLSTLAVLQLDAILPNAVLKKSSPANKEKKNQKGFKKMLTMEYDCPGIGKVRLTVGVKGTDNTKVQYCITAILA